MAKFVRRHLGNVQGIIEAVLASFPPIGEDEISFNDLVIGLPIDAGGDIAATEIAADGKHAAAIGFPCCWIHVL